MAEFYCDQTLQFSSIYFAAEWIMKSAFKKPCTGHSGHVSCGLSTLVADKSSAANKKALAVRQIYEEVAQYWTKRASLCVFQQKQNYIWAFRYTQTVKKKKRKKIILIRLKCSSIKRKCPIYEEQIF